jgi:hypothetical protein
VPVLQAQLLQVQAAALVVIAASRALLPQVLARVLYTPKHTAVAAAVVVTKLVQQVGLVVAVVAQPLQAPRLQTPLTLVVRVVILPAELPIPMLLEGPARAAGRLIRVQPMQATPAERQNMAEAAAAAQLAATVLQAMVVVHFTVLVAAARERAQTVVTLQVLLGQVE